MHQEMTQEQIRYHLMQKKFLEHQRLMALAQERIKRLEQERIARENAAAPNASAPSDA
jgi:hypothetical protein